MADINIKPYLDRIDKSRIGDKSEVGCVSSHTGMILLFVYDVDKQEDVTLMEVNDPSLSDDELQHLRDKANIIVSRIADEFNVQKHIFEWTLVPYKDSAKFNKEDAAGDACA